MFWKFAFLLMLMPISVFGSISISKDQAEIIGMKIWQNECNGTVEGLTSWNSGENFASIGIGHFIWYPKGIKGRYEEQFPRFITFIINHHQPCPEWLCRAEGCPWKNREEFLKEVNSPMMVELRDFLKSTISMQTLFITRRLEQALPRILVSLSETERMMISYEFYRVASEPMGIYALVDYVNFKGEGISPSEQYNGYGWGLLQVLHAMSVYPSTIPPLQAFASAAKAILAKRVQESPPDRNEQLWLKGWYNRIDTYTAPIEAKK